MKCSFFLQVAEIFGIKIFHYVGSLNFVNASHLSSVLQQTVGVSPRQVLKHRVKLAKRGIYTEPNDFETRSSLRCIVMDMSAVTYIDATGVAMLRELVHDFGQIDVPLYLAACSAAVYDQIGKCELIQKGELTFVIFATVHDAVFYAQRDIVTKSS